MSYLVYIWNKIFFVLKNYLVLLWSIGHIWYRFQKKFLYKYNVEVCHIWYRFEHKDLCIQELSSIGLKYISYIVQV